MSPLTQNIKIPLDRKSKITIKITPEKSCLDIEISLSSKLLKNEKIKESKREKLGFTGAINSEVKNKSEVNNKTENKDVCMMVNYWNNQHILPKLLKSRGGKTPKKYTNVAVLCGKFLHGSLYTAKNIILPDYFKSKLPKTLIGKRTVQEFYTYVDRYVLSVSDLAYYGPKKAADIEHFLIGSAFTKTPSVSHLLLYCVNEPKPIYTDPNPVLTGHVTRYWHLLLDDTQVFTGNDIKKLSDLAKRIGEFGKTHPIPLSDSSKHFSIYFLAIKKQWSRGARPSIVWVCSDKGWECFCDFYAKQGY